MPAAPPASIPSFDAPQAPNARLLLRCLLVSLLIWTLFGVALGLGNYIDLQRSGRHGTLLQSIGVMLPFFTAQIVFSALVGVLLACRPGWLQHPWRLGLAALAVLPLHLAASLPINAAVRTLIAGDGAPGMAKRLAEWSGTQIWVDLMIAGAALLTQVSWRLWRRSQARDRAWQQAQADNLRLRLTLLQGQLEPHFLFNTLNSIAALVRSAERGVALQALNRLSELLRYALRASQQRWVSVADELRFVDEYIALQRLRFGEGLRWEATVESSDWTRWACPPLLLQPLVENAVRYGLEAAEPGRDANLRLSVARVGQQLLLHLSNPRGEATQLMAGHGLGLAKTRERLQVLYGERAQLETHALPDRFDLQLRLPLDDLDALLEAAQEDEHAQPADR